MVIEKLKKILNIAFKNAGFECDCEIIESNRPELCNYQCDSSFKLAKAYKTAPMIIGNKVVEELKKLECFGNFFESFPFI